MPPLNECRDEAARARLDSLEGRMHAIESSNARIEASCDEQTPMLRQVVETIGSSPDPARGVEGRGMARQVAELVVERDGRRRSRAGLLAAIGVVGVVVGILAGGTAVYAAIRGPQPAAERK